MAKERQISCSRIIANRVTNGLGYGSREHYQPEDHTSLQIHLGDMERQSHGLDSTSRKYMEKLYRRIDQPNSGPLDLKSIFRYSVAALLVAAMTTPLVLDHFVTRYNAFSQQTESLQQVVDADIAYGAAETSEEKNLILTKTSPIVDNYNRATAKIIDQEELNSLSAAAKELGIIVGGASAAVLAVGAYASRRKQNLTPRYQEINGVIGR